MQCYKTITLHQEGKGYVYVPCGNCNYCLQNKRTDWAFRLNQENKIRKTAKFITLTYADKHMPYVWENDIPLANTLDKHDLWKFHKAITNSQKRLLKKEYNNWKIRYYSVGEYGTKTGRPHYHSIMFNIHPEVQEKLALGKIWRKGLVHIGEVTQASTMYVAKYIVDKPMFKEVIQQKTFATMSRRPGIGHNYLTSNSAWHKEPDQYNPDNYKMYVMEDGKKKRMPRYYKDRIFKEENELLKGLFDTSMDLFYMDLGEKMDIQLDIELERLAKIHPDPINYYIERRKEHHDKIRTKSHALNTY